MEPKREIPTPDSPRWATFIEELESCLSECGCDGDSPEHVHRYSKAVMREMGGVDVAVSLAYFQENGGYCDCEILLNVDQEWSWANNDPADASGVH